MVHLLTAVVRAQPDHVPLVGDDIGELVRAEEALTAEYASAPSFRVSIEMARERSPSKPKLMIVCAMSGEPWYTRNRSRLRRVAR